MASFGGASWGRARRTEYVRDSLKALHHHSSGGAERLWALAIAYPAVMQGLYFLATGLWPLFSIDSFQAVTGPKTDLWLVQTVGAFVVVIGAVLCLAAYRSQKTLEIRALALGSAGALAFVDVYFVVHGRISAIYLLDAAVEMLLIVLWFSAWYSDSAGGTTNTAAVQGAAGSNHASPGQ